MSKSRHTEAQMIGALKQLEAGRKAMRTAMVCGLMPLLGVMGRGFSTVSGRGWMISTMH